MHLSFLHLESWQKFSLALHIFVYMHTYVCMRLCSNCSWSRKTIAAVDACLNLMATYLWWKLKWKKKLCNPLEFKTLVGQDAAIYLNQPAILPLLPKNIKKNKILSTATDTITKTRYANKLPNNKRCYR